MITINTRSFINYRGKGIVPTLLPSLILLLIFFAGCTSTGVKTAVENTEAQGDQNEEIEGPSNIEISQFIIGVGDSVDIAVYRHDDLQSSIRVNNSGKIMFPLIGDVQVAGVGIFDLRKELESRLSHYVVNPQVMVNVTGIQSKKTIVLGEVNSPGFFVLDTDISVVEAISRAGGATSNAKLGNVVLMRRDKDKPKIYALNIKDVWKNGDLSQNMMLEHGDIIFVPRMIISNIARYFSYFQQMFSAIISFESGVILYPQARDVLTHGETEAGGGTTINIPVN
ncbi:MAG: hypothetical protein E3K37_00140 [Candidatus Kuenenia sp.]|nr:hypothetical protein [Candidatus Kuenenia hertensis]